MKPLACLLATLIAFSAQPAAAAEDPAPLDNHKPISSATTVCIVKDLEAHGNLLISGIFAVDDTKYTPEDILRSNCAIVITQTKLISKEAGGVNTTDDYTQQHEPLVINLCDTIPDTEPLLKKLTASSPPAKHRAVAYFTLCLAHRAIGDIYFDYRTGQARYEPTKYHDTGFIAISFPADTSPNPTPASTVHPFILCATMRTITTLGEQLNCPSLWAYFQECNFMGVAWSNSSGLQHFIPAPLPTSVMPKVSLPDPFSHLPSP